MNPIIHPQESINIKAAIKATAKLILKTNGLFELSLSEIGSRLNVQTHAIHNHYSTIEELIEAIMIGGYHAFAAAVAETENLFIPDRTGKFVALARAHRNWAHKNPEMYSLLFSAPIYGPTISKEVMLRASTESIKPYILLLDKYLRDGMLNFVQAPNSTLPLLYPWAQKVEYGGPAFVIQVALAIWSQIHGLITLELVGPFSSPTNIGDFSHLFDSEIINMLTRIGLAASEANGSDVKKGNNFSTRTKNAIS